MARKRSSRTVTVHTVLYDGTSPGPAGDYTHTARFRDLGPATRFAASRTCYGAPATVRTDTDVPAHLAARWGV